MKCRIVLVNTQSTRRPGRWSPGDRPVRYLGEAGPRPRIPRAGEGLPDWRLWRANAAIRPGGWAGRLRPPRPLIVPDIRSDRRLISSDGNGLLSLWGFTQREPHCGTGGHYSRLYLLFCESIGLLFLKGLFIWSEYHFQQDLAQLQGQRRHSERERQEVTQ